MAWGALIGAGLGAAKQYEDRKAAQRARQQEAQIAQWSPWTGMQGQRTQDPSLMGNVGYGALTGGMMEQQMGKPEQAPAGQNAMPSINEAQSSNYNTNPTTYSLSPYQSNMQNPGQKMDIQTWLALQPR